VTKTQYIVIVNKVIYMLLIKIVKKNKECYVNK